ncbi:MAG TPA: ubiquinone biosynthesis regulatory protein kinase UbiB, partial [Gammaproteobacteria bacterium]|nr:ubiquinone biosynthesis regulatory protein kinase UbiB [Gammaproteobacteria bacterium]
RLLLRLLSIQNTLIRHGLDEIIWQTHLFRPVAWLQRLVPRPAGMRKRPFGDRLRNALEELGPIFVKFGQALSVRRDLLSPEIGDELAKLQDQVPPFPSETAVELLERAFGREVGSVYAEFEREPLAAASIAQVHAARLLDGTSVVVKILRPDVRRQVRRDVEVMFAVARLAERYWPDARRLRAIEVVEEFQKTLLHELDLMREAANAAQLKRNFAGSNELYVPQVYWDYCRANVMTMERIYGIPISNIAALKERGTDIKRLAENGVEIFFTQVFRHNFFHADMHPGNIFVDVGDPLRPRYLAVDFGIVGTLSERDQHYLAENFIAFFKRDYRRVATLHVDSGWVPPDTRIDELESAVRAVCEPIFDRPLKDISFGLLLLRLFETAREFDMEVQPQLVLLQKTLLAIEGIGRELYPDLDLWTTAKPVLEEWMRERKDPRVQLRRLVDAWPIITEDLLLLPEILHRAIQRAASAGTDGASRWTEPAQGFGPARPLSKHEWALRERALRVRFVWERLFVGATLLIAGVLWAGFAAKPIWVGWLGAAFGMAILLVNALRRA